MVPFGEYKETNILYSNRKLFKVQLGNLDTGLQVKEKHVQCWIGLLEKSWKDLQTTKSKKWIREKLE
jgi:hypothetical protein